MRPTAESVARHPTIAAAIAVMEGDWKQCTKCGDSWPLTADYWYRTSARRGKRWHSWCRACYSDWTAAKRRRHAKTS